MSGKASWALFRGSLLSLLCLGFFLSASSVQAATYSVTITATQFVPATLQATVGDSITFINSTTATQSAKSTTSSGFNTGDIGPNKSKSVTLANEGTFTYTSLYDPALTGVVTVTAGSTSLSTTTTASTTASVTSNPSSTQPQPVSGTAETLMMIVGAGIALFITGGYARWKDSRAGITLIDVPLVSSKHGTIHSPDADQRE